MSFYRNRKPFSKHLMKIVRVERREGKAAWVHPIVIVLEDDKGIVTRPYGASEQGEANRSAGEPGDLREVHFGINSQPTHVEKVEGEENV